MCTKAMAQQHVSPAIPALLQSASTALVTTRGRRGTLARTTSTCLMVRRMQSTWIQSSRRSARSLGSLWQHLQTLLNTLNAMKVRPRDTIEIIKSLHKVGAIHGEVIDE